MSVQARPLTGEFESSLPVTRAEKTWGPLAIFGNTSSAAVATWCFISGGFVAAYLGATQGALAVTAGTLIGVFMVLLAALPAAGRYGVEAVRSTRPLFGSRGSVLTVVLTLLILIGWNAVLTIALADASALALAEMGWLTETMIGPTAMIVAVGSALVVFLLLRKGTATLRWAGPVVAVTVLILAVWIGIMLIIRFGIDGILSAGALAPLPDNGSNFMLTVELGIAGGLSWWPYVGGLTRNARTTRAAIVPSVLGLGVMMSLVLIIGLIAALVVPESGGDPTGYLIEIGGPVFGVVALSFLALANVGTIMVGAYSAALGLKQIPTIDRRVPWSVAVAVVMLPVLVIAVFFADAYMANYGAFITLAGILLGPICGMQIVDFFLVRRQELDIRALYSVNGSGSYWYFAGINPAGIVGLIVGMGTYLALLDPFTYVPPVDLGVIAAAVPAAIAAGVVYLIILRFVPRLWSSRRITTDS
ncbi:MULTISPECIES: cytosine permease [Brevibacterium]|uniref:Cytosine permease n=1 Tax=Brevibacterium casei TaxID=33889 RepID=A0A7T3ZXG6_9MICO|nr:cytosine permease [Brevibacterium casei]QQB13517.1 cytosine permease [Brevibacterium casei]